MIIFLVIEFKISNLFKTNDILIFVVIEVTKKKGCSPKSIPLSKELEDERILLIYPFQRFKNYKIFDFSNIKSSC